MFYQYMIITFFLPVLVFAVEFSGIDHGRLSNRHVQSARKFIAEKLMEDGEYSIAKVRQFIAFIERERDLVQQQVYDTELIENLELYTKNEEKSRRKAAKKSRGPKAKIPRWYDEYFLPKLHALLELLEIGGDRVAADALVADFVRGYSGFFVPNSFRSRWPLDTDITHVGKKIFSSHKFRSRDRKIEAFNLLVNAQNFDEIRLCLRNVRVGSYLSPGAISKLRRCGFDISRINPGVSSLWSPPGLGIWSDSPALAEQFFPLEGEKLFLDRVNYRSRTSPKVKAFFTRGGVEYKIKIKLGQEVQTDLFTAKVMESMGFSADQMRYYPKVRVYLTDHSFHEFKTLFVNKYGIESFAQFLRARGEEDGVEWIEFEDVLIEVRPNYEVRVGPFQVSSWDFANRREFRSLLLLFAWLGLNDMHAGNNKQLFYKKFGKYWPIHRIHDTGAALGGVLHIESAKKIGNIFSFMQYYRVNAFKEKFLGDSIPGDLIKIHWNDFGLWRKYFKSTTWSDLKWMARKILDLPPKLVKKHLLQSGMPKPIVDLYYVKLMRRRNEIRKVFQLKDYSRVKVPKLENMNLKDEHGVVYEKGVLRRKIFPNKMNPVHVPDNWWTFIPKLFMFEIPISQWTKGKTRVNLGLSGLEGLKVGLGLNSFGREDLVYTSILGAGLQAKLSRRVEANDHILNTGKSIKFYKIIDSIRIRADADSPALHALAGTLPLLKADASLRFFEKRFQHIHYCDFVKRSYTKPFRLLKAILDPKKFAAFKLKALEHFHTYNRIGVEIDAGAGVLSVPNILNNEVSILAGSRRASSTYYVRDHFGNLHFFYDRERKNSLGLNIDVLRIGSSTYSLPLFQLNAGYLGFKYKLEDYIFKPRSMALEQQPDPLDEYLALKNFKRGGTSDADSQMGVNFTLSSKGSNKIGRLGAGFLWKRAYKGSGAHTEVVLPDGGKRLFYHYQRERSRYFGLSATGNPSKTYDLLVKDRRQTKFQLEMDCDRPLDARLIIRSEDYFYKRSPDKLKLLLKSFNNRYSESPEVPFYTDISIPKGAEIPKTIKIYGLHRIFIAAKKIEQALLALGSPKLALQVLVPSANVPLSQRLSFRKNKFKVNLYLKKIFSHIKDRVVAGGEGYVKVEEKHAKNLLKLLYYLEIDVKGVSPLLSLLGSDGLFVLGEVSGILRSFSPLNDIQQLQRRRFAGRSWGKHPGVLPIQRFLRKYRLILPSAHVGKLVSDSDTLGRLQTLVPTNLDGLFNHDDSF